jgi:4-diphosphocytidyl-2C-methyl-D-erythritol kinase
MEEALTRGGLVDDNLYNVFERVAPTVFPNFSHLRECLENSTSRRAHLSGSGPSLFYMPSGEEEYLRVAEALHSCAVKVYFVHTIAPSHFQAQANS